MVFNVQEGFSKASSDNLPYIDAFMIHEFYKNNPDYLSSASSHAKSDNATRDDYSSKALGWVQVKTDENGTTTVRGKMVPEHKVRNKPYDVEVVVNENRERVVSSRCLSCAASEGGCKHAIAFLFWLHRRSEEASVTEKTCYWAAPKLSKVARSGLPMDLASLIKRAIPPIAPKGDIIGELMENVPRGVQSSVIIMKRVTEYKQKLSVHQLLLKFCCHFHTDEERNADNFIDFMRREMDSASCENAKKETERQNESPVWFELRYGRITASKLFEASRCKTMQGSLNKVVLGATKFHPTEAIIRGCNLESDVLKEVAKQKKITIKRSGLILNEKFPIFGASPDGVSDDFVIEIKCPSKHKTIINYVENGSVKPKYLAQIQLQMYFANKGKGLFCVASPTFENDRNVSIHEIMFNKNWCEKVMKDAAEFWKTSVFQALMKT